MHEYISCILGHKPHYHFCTLYMNLSYWGYGLKVINTNYKKRYNNSKNNLFIIHYSINWNKLLHWGPPWPDYPDKLTVKYSLYFHYYDIIGRYWTKGRKGDWLHFPYGESERNGMTKTLGKKKTNNSEIKFVCLALSMEETIYIEERG